MSEPHAKNSKGPFDVDRSIPLLPVAADILEEATRKVSALEPVVDAYADRRGHLQIRYDASSIGIRDIERLLDESGVGRLSNAWWRLKLAWYRFVDDNARSSVHSTGGACCNRPPTPWSGDHDVGRKE
ncbi:MAG: hypothetical protein B7Z35_10815 [Hydrogenophilales bacterium 12-61-10]|nr:MAG: hypothetical protein B7Z35_10815 [Hydrogenophilales bacterium 12-61-10]OYX29627.1 MAG: hypothetical protein B7Z03_08420 [Hydrogenophilales bacterium 32-62-9]OYY60235.1 MAG: hypothetical protein B7Y50_08030 [Hydrogenophilales bacterium 28-61-11]OZA50936.1 MAG: hypothetical protein B7X81_00980 [Hydrogenophilales bacterium 17-61-76]